MKGVITEMNPESDLEQYITLQAQIDALSAQRDELKAKLLEQLPNKTTVHNGYTFSKAVRTTYTHTKAIKAQEKSLKKAKQFEIETGLATAKETEFLTVRKVS